MNSLHTQLNVWRRHLFYYEGFKSYGDLLNKLCLELSSMNKGTLIKRYLPYYLTYVLFTVRILASGYSISQKIHVYFELDAMMAFVTSYRQYSLEFMCVTIVGVMMCIAVHWFFYFTVDKEFLELLDKACVNNYRQLKTNNKQDWKANSRPDRLIRTLWSGHRWHFSQSLVGINSICKRTRSRLALLYWISDQFFHTFLILIELLGVLLLINFLYYTWCNYNFLYIIIILLDGTLLWDRLLVFVQIISALIETGNFAGVFVWFVARDIARCARWNVKTAITRTRLLPGYLLLYRQEHSKLVRLVLRSNAHISPKLHSMLLCALVLNIYIVVYCSLTPMTLEELLTLGLAAIAQLFGTLFMILPMSYVPDALHCGKWMTPLQAQLRAPQLGHKLKLMTYFELVHARQESQLGFTIGPTKLINHQTLLEILLLYGAYVLFTLDLLTD